MQASLYSRCVICTNDLARLLSCMCDLVSFQATFTPPPGRTAVICPTNAWHVSKKQTIFTNNTGYELQGLLEKKCERPNHMLTESTWQRKKHIMSLNTKWYCNVCPLSQKKHSKIAITWLNWLNTHMSSAMIINSFISQKWGSRLNSFNFVGKATTVIKALRDETPG